MCCVEESLLEISSLKEKKRAVQYFILFFALEQKYIKSTLNLFLQNRHGKFFKKNKHFQFK